MSQKVYTNMNPLEASYMVRGRYDTLSALQTAYPSGSDYVFNVGNADNATAYFWNGSAWTVLGNLRGNIGKTGATGQRGEKGDKGDKGDTGVGTQGDQGTGLQFIWNGTQLGIKREDETEYSYVNLQGAVGQKGDKGDIGLTGNTGETGKGLEFTWNGTSLGVRVEGETTYLYTDLKGAKGDTGDTGRNITSVVRTSGDGSPGSTDIYTITFSDATTQTFTIYNGANGTGTGNAMLYSGTCATAVGTALKAVIVGDGTHIPVAGEIYAITFTNGNSANTVTVSVNGDTAYNIKFNNSNTNGVFFTLNAGATVLLYFDGTAYNMLGSQRTTDTDTDSFNKMYWSSTNITVGAVTNAYKLLMQGVDGKFYPLTLESGTGTTKTVSTQTFLVGSPILWYQSSMQVAANGILTASLYSEYYETNLSNTANATSFTSQALIYLKGTLNANGYFVLDNTTYTSWLTQTVPTTEDGFVYMLLGYVYSTTGMRLLPNHPIYQYKNGKFRLYQEDIIVTDNVTSTSTTSALSANQGKTIWDTLQTFISGIADTIRGTVLTGLSTATNSVITATDTVLDALGKLQAQVTARLPLSGGTMTGILNLQGASNIATEQLSMGNAKIIVGSTGTIYFAVNCNYFVGESTWKYTNDGTASLLVLSATSGGATYYYAVSGTAGANIASWTENSKPLQLTGGTMTGILTAQNNTSYTTAQARNTIISTSDASGGGNGDIWLKYS